MNVIITVIICLAPIIDC